MRHVARSTVAVFLAGSMLFGLVACGPGAEVVGEVAPAEAAEASDGGGADPSVEMDLPPEFTAPIGEGLMLGEERVDTSTTIEELVEEAGMSKTSYRPILIAPESPLLDFDASAPYAHADPSRTALVDHFSDQDADSAMSFASRYVVETWMDSPIRMENDPDANLEWFEQNKHLFHTSLHDSVRESLSTPGGRRHWVLGVYIPGDTDSDAQRITDIRPAYDIAATRWTDIQIEPSMAIGGFGGEEHPYSEIVYVRYHVTGNILWKKLPDSEDPNSLAEPLALSFEANVAVSVVRESPNDEWQLAELYSNWSSVGDPIEELEHPWD